MTILFTFIVDFSVLRPCSRVDGCEGVEGMCGLHIYDGRCCLAHARLYNVITWNHSVNFHRSEMSDVMQFVSFSNGKNFN
jgi:hypothetical protein